MLYKFIENEHLISFFNTGCLRLGTLYNFKDTIEHGESRGDPSESEHNLIRHSGNFLVLSPGNSEPLFSRVFNVQGQGRLTLSGVSIEVAEKTADAFVFCTSYTFKESIFRRWNHEENLDSCYKIVNPKAFFLEISRAIASRARLYDNAHVTYTEEHIEYNSAEAAINPAFTKHKEKYDWQCENRTVWAAQDPCENLEPWVVHVPKAIQYCRQYAFIKNGSLIYA